MSELVKLCDVDEISDDAALQVNPPDIEPIAVCKVNGEIYAISDTCSHGLAYLSDGEVEGDIIYCPFHGGSFKITTGEPVDHPCTIAITKYEVVEKDGAVFLVREG